MGFDRDFSWDMTGLNGGSWDMTGMMMGCAWSTSSRSTGQRIGDVSRLDVGDRSTTIV